ncbi:MAG: efflux RND transporter periplasmic adaptor subunit [Vicinamibacterales bacterium]
MLSISVAVAAIAAVSACGHKAVEQTETTAAVPVVVESAKLDVIQGTITVSGVVTPAPGAELTVVAPEAARIAEIPKGEGDAVKVGDVLVRFDIPTLGSDVSARRAAVAQATARVDAAKASYARLSSLVSQGVAAPREVEEAKRAQAEAEAELEQAHSAADAAVALSGRAVVRATFSGVIAKRFHNPGDLVESSASDPVLKIINPAQLQIVASVPVGSLTRVVPGHAASVHLPGREETEPARVLTKAAQVDAAGATADVRLAFTKPTSLPAGTTVQLEIVGEERKNAIVIPSAAVVEDEGDIFVMVAGPDNKAHKYPVSVGLTTQTMSEVTSGLKAGDRVIVRGQAELPEGAAITIEAK